MTPQSPGSAGERALQRQLGTADRADRFYGDQLLDHLNPQMRDFVRRQQMFFLATSDRAGECDNTLRAGPPGFLEVLDDRTLAWPEYKGNGVMASLGNISENPHVGLLLVDFVHDTVGLHVNGGARILPTADAARLGLEARSPAGSGARLWVQVDVEEAYIHCSKHIPRLAEVDSSGATDAPPVRRSRTADYFGAAARCDDASAAS
ncbi:MAG TPA: pyridoxamine 5'-phosphate oxidase family protein [Actinomycetes bacterium]|nr:pyridoxamine 5'-phosphate oxidase family protein [Actinomycetes bacterium]